MHNRRNERSALKRKLETGRSIHMLAPRRIGKTWTMSRLASDLREGGWQVVEMDVEGMRTSTEFAEDLCKRLEAQSATKALLATHFRERLSNLAGGKWGDKLADAAKVDPIEFAGALIAMLDGSGKKTALIIDEIAYFFLAFAQENEREAQAFAYKLRAIQQRHKNVRWLLTGSIGLDVIARRYQLEGAFVDFDKFELEPFTAAEARSYLRDPTIQQQFNHVFDADDADLDWMFQQLGWLAPYYLQLVANEVRPSTAGEDGRPARATQADFEAALEKLLRPNRQSEFAVWHEHISKNLPEADRKLAERILNVLSTTAEGETPDTLHAQAAQIQGSVTTRQVRDILDMLDNDGLIVKNGDRYAFRSGLVRRYWNEYRA